MGLQGPGLQTLEDVRVSQSRYLDTIANTDNDLVIVPSSPVSGVGELQMTRPMKTIKTSSSSRVGRNFKSEGATGTVRAVAWGTSLSR